MPARSPRRTLRGVKIQTKLLGVLAVPVLVLVLVASLVSVQAVGQARRAENVKTVATSASTFARLVAGLQLERSLSVRSFGRDYDARRASAQLPAVHAAVDAELAAADALVARADLTSLSAETAGAVAAIPRTKPTLAAIRAAVADGKADRDGIAAQYTAMIDGNLTLLEQLAHGLTDKSLGQRIKAFTDISGAAELAVQERDLGMAIITSGAQTAAQTGEMARLAADQDSALEVFAYDATARQKEALTQELASDLLIKDVFPRARGHFSAVGESGASSLSTARWQLSADERIDAFGAVAATVAGDAARAAAKVADDASRRATGVLTVTVALVLLSIALGMVLSRAITRPIVALTAAAGQVRERLPRMVEQIAAPGAEPMLELPDIPVTSSDEVGQLAAAFRSVNETTLAVATEQAALRASIAEMFVNVARRNQVLLSRQLSFIDQLERSEENPAVLDDLFKLDHLATRMRRNAESLIVLAGIDSGRRMRQPMPLADVVRTAVSEIEHYDRVDLTFGEDSSVLGHAALTAAHLLAELLENATHFSDPTSRVAVLTERTDTGIRVTVADEGLGMSDAELAEANAHIGSPPVSEVLGSQRLGLFVVGRLARRLEATVVLRTGPVRGVLATVDLPSTVLVAEVMPEPVASVTLDPLVMPMIRPPVPLAAPAVEVPVVIVARTALEVPVVAEAAWSPVLLPTELAPAMLATRAQVQSAFAVEPHLDVVPPSEPAPEPAPHAVPAPEPEPEHAPESAPESASVPAPEPGPHAAPEPALEAAPVPEPLPALAPVAHGFAPATVDVLPQRGGRGLLRRRPTAHEAGASPFHAPAPTQAPVEAALAPLPRRPLRQSPAVTQEPFAIDATHLVHAPTPADQLAELARDSYRPAAVDPAPSDSLTRRTPSGAVAPAAGDDVPHRLRSATEVRSVLSGFQAGVARGRTSALLPPVTGSADGPDSPTAPTTTGSAS